MEFRDHHVILKCIFLPFLLFLLVKKDYFFSHHNVHVGTHIIKQIKVIFYLFFSSNL